MRPGPTTDAIVPVDAGPGEYDEVLGVYTFYVVIPRPESVYFRLVVESWEDFAVARTMERFHEGDPTRSVVVVMAVPDYLGPCVRALGRLCAEVGGRPIATTPALRAALRRDLLDPQA